MKIFVSRLFATMLVTVLCVAFGNVSGLFTSDTIVRTAKAEEPGITLYAAIIEWRYKIIDGYIYRRQFNHTTQQWIGEWELCV
jgi:hypothetical protein